MRAVGLGLVNITSLLDVYNYVGIAKYTFFNITYLTLQKLTKLRATTNRSFYVGPSSFINLIHLAFSMTN